MSAAPLPRQRGSLLIMFAMLLAGLLAFVGMALDVAQVYNRQTELQNLADTVALAAARSLNGTGPGIAEAAARAGTVAESHVVGYRVNVEWDDKALRFSEGPDGPWLSVGGAQDAAQSMLYARVDTANLNAAYGEVATVFMRAIDPDSAQLTAAASAVARRDSIEVTPLAVCALDKEAAGERAYAGPPSVIKERVQHGFRLGVSYNLLMLNPQAGATEGEYFLINPLGGLDGSAAAGSAADDVVAPFMCSGTVQLPRVLKRSVAVRRPGTFRLAEQLNSRFNEYGVTPSACVAAVAPPDTNIAEYMGVTVNWMKTAPTVPHASTPDPANAGEPLYTVADRAAGVAAPNGANYGPLWAYARPRGDTGNLLSTTNWNRLYPALSSAPVATLDLWPTAPYLRTSGVQFLSPGDVPARRDRRLLNIPLLQCPVPAGAEAQATVLAIGRFLLTAKASGTQVSAEFAGLLSSEAALASNAELVR